MPAHTNQQKTQRARLLALLVRARGAEVSLHEIAKLGIAQHGARLSELKELGFVIRNRQEIVDGERRSWYRLLPGPSLTTPAPPAPAESETLFGDISPAPEYPG